MKRAIIMSLALVCAALAGVVMNVQTAEAQENTAVRPCSRCGEWEFTLPIIYTDAATLDGEGNSSVEINGGWGIGFGLGYNFNDHLQLNGVLSFSNRDYDATFFKEDDTSSVYNGTLDTVTLALNGVYYILNRDFTPFVSAGIGVTNIDTNIPSGAGSSYCYWDPWWGYVCGTYVPTKTENDVSYNAGLGLRWDISKYFSLQGSYNKTWVDISGASGGMPDFDIFKMEFIFRTGD